LTLLANLGVVAGIFFLVLETRSNTESNIIGIQEAFAGNYIEINTFLADPEQAQLMYKARMGEPLSGEDTARLETIVRLFLSQSNLIRRLYDRDVVGEEELREAYRAIRELARDIPAIRKIFEEGMGERSRSLVLDEDGVEKYIDESR